MCIYIYIKCLIHTKLSINASSYDSLWVPNIHLFIYSAYVVSYYVSGPMWSIGVQNWISYSPPLREHTVWVEETTKDRSPAQESFLAAPPGLPHCWSHCPATLSPRPPRILMSNHTSTLHLAHFQTPQTPHVQPHKHSSSDTFSNTCFWQTSRINTYGKVNLKLSYYLFAYLTILRW